LAPDKLLEDLAPDSLFDVLRIEPDLEGDFEKLFETEFFTRSSRTEKFVRPANT
jgi:hypothetical protein